MEKECAHRCMYLDEMSTKHSHKHTYIHTHICIYDTCTNMQPISKETDGATFQKHIVSGDQSETIK